MNAREVALNVLCRIEKSKQYSNIALDAALKNNLLSPEDRALCTVLVYGVIEKKLTLDHLLSRLSSRPVEKLDPAVRMLLRLGLYQLSSLDRVPNHAAVNETVSLAPAKARGFVNAVLREYLRHGCEIPFPNREREPIAYLSATYSVCPELCEKFSEVFGMERTESLFRADLRHPLLTLRVNQNRISREDFIARLAKDGIKAEETALAPHGVRLLSGTAPTSLPGFEDGLFFVQDEASQLAVEAVDVAPDMKVLDVCACPGSKSFGMAWNMNNCGDLLACDLHASKLSLINDGAKRLGITIIFSMERDARNALTGWEGTADRILCDVPCSGYGVMAKKPELRYKDPSDSSGLPEIQYAILERSSTLLRSGGKLVYSTCTVLPEENEKNIEKFLQNHPDFSLRHQKTSYPDTDMTDGFFVAVLQKQ